jgi:hypothetical protein
VFVAEKSGVSKVFVGVAGGLSHTVTRRLDPRTVVLSFQTSPGGLQLTVGSTTSVAALQPHGDRRSRNTISPPEPQRKGGKSYTFASWSVGWRPRSHDIIAPATTAYTARFRAR